MSILRSRSGSKRASKPVAKQSPKLVKPRLVLPFPHFYLGLGLILTLIFSAGIMFFSQKLINLAQEIELKRGQLEALKEKETALKKLAADLKLVAEEIKILDEALPDEKGIVQFVKRFKETGKNVSIQVFNFDTDQPITIENGSAYIDFDAEIRGNLADLQLFLERLSSLPYLVKLKLVDISEIDQETAQMVIQARIFVDQPFFQGGS